MYLQILERFDATFAWIRNIFLTPIKNSKSDTPNQKNSLPCDQDKNRENYSLIAVIGSGSYAKVYHAIKNEKEECALKIVELNNLLSTWKCCYREAVILNHIKKHTNNSKESGICAFNCGWLDEETNMIYLDMPRYELDLRKFIINSFGGIPEEHVKYMAYMFLKGLCALHEAGIVHRDIKPSNALLNATTGEISISDFNLSSSLEQPMCKGFLSQEVCSIYYKAPEILSNDEKTRENNSNNTMKYEYGLSIDIWAAACVIFEMAMGPNPLFAASSKAELMQFIAKDFGIDTKKYSHEDLVQISLGIFTDQNNFSYDNFNLKQRFKCNRFFKSNKKEEGFEDFIVFMLNFNSKNRPSARACLKHPWILKTYAEPPQNMLPQLKISSYSTIEEYKRELGVFLYRA